jgi:hypothetical protein
MGFAGMGAGAGGLGKGRDAVRTTGAAPGVSSIITRDPDNPWPGRA